MSEHGHQSNATPDENRLSVKSHSRDPHHILAAAEDEEEDNERGFEELVKRADIEED